MPNFVSRPEIKLRLQNQIKNGTRVFIGDDFSSLDLSGIDFQGCTIIDVNFTNSYLFLAIFSKCKIDRVSFDYSDLEAAQFYSTTLTNVSFRNSYLKVTNFTMAKLISADFSYADLSDTFFTVEKFESVALNGAKYDTGTAWPEWDESGFFRKPFKPEKYGAVKV